MSSRLTAKWTTFEGIRARIEAGCQRSPNPETRGQLSLVWVGDGPMCPIPSGPHGLARARYESQNSAETARSREGIRARIEVGC